MVSPKGLFVGSSSFDFISLLDSSFNLTAKQRAKKQAFQVGGLSANAAISFAVLGGKTSFFTCLGNSDASSLCKNELENYNIAFQDVAPDSYELATSSIILNDKERCIISSPKPDKEIEFKPYKNPNLFDILLIDGFHPHAYMPAIETAKDIGVPCVWDADKWRSDSYHDLVKNVDIVIASAEFMPPDCTNQQDVINYFKDKKIKLFAITNGEKPIKVFENNEEYQIQIEEIQALDTLAAGDVFHGAFCYYYAQRLGFRMALEKAAKVASFSCQYFGREWISNLQQLESGGL